KARPKRRVHSPRFDVRTALSYVVGLDVTEIEGISDLTALTVISAIGPGVSQFATVKQFGSWLGLCSNWKKTGGRVTSRRTRRGVNRAAQALRLAAQSLHHRQGALGGFRRRLKGRRGAQAAVTATAHQLGRIVYLALTHGMTYVRQSQEEYEAQRKEKPVKALRRKARQLGLEVIEKTSVSVPTAAAEPVQGERRTRGGQQPWGRGPRGATGKSEEDQPVGQLLGCGRRACAPGRTRRRNHLGALGKLSGAGSLQPKRSGR